jgi:hypothetical protein
MSPRHIATQSHLPSFPPFTRTIAHSYTQFLQSLRHLVPPPALRSFMRRSVSPSHPLSLAHSISPASWILSLRHIRSFCPSFSLHSLVTSCPRTVVHSFTRTLAPSFHLPLDSHPQLTYITSFITCTILSTTGQTLRNFWSCFSPGFLLIRVISVYVQIWIYLLSEMVVRDKRSWSRGII